MNSFVHCLTILTKSKKLVARGNSRNNTLPLVFVLEKPTLCPKLIRLHSTLILATLLMFLFKNETS